MSYQNDTYIPTSAEKMMFSTLVYEDIAFFFSFMTKDYTIICRTKDFVLTFLKFQHENFNFWKQVEFEQIKMMDYYTEVEINSL